MEVLLNSELPRTVFPLREVGGIRAVVRGGF
jgi:hypothetical protein